LLKTKLKVRKKKTESFFKTLKKRKSGERKVWRAKQRKKPEGKQRIVGVTLRDPRYKI